MLSPEKWLQWYAPGGVIDPSGRHIHDYNLWRYAFFIALSAPVTGAWLLAYRRYLAAGNRADAAYLQWVDALARRLLVVGGVVALGLLAGWMATLPAALAGFAVSPIVWLAAGLLLATAALPWLLGARTLSSSLGYAPLALGLVALIAVGALRELLRYGVLQGVHGYDPLDYKVNVDWYSTALFFSTFALIGGITLAYFLTIAWKVGHTPEGKVYTPSPAVDRLGTAAIWLIGLWIVQYFAIGLYVWAR